MKKVTIYYISLVALLIVTMKGNCQIIELSIKSNNVITIQEREDQKGVENTFYMKDSLINVGNTDWDWSYSPMYNFYDNWIIYYKMSKNDTASYSLVSGDTCVIIQLWENRQLKAKETFIKKELKGYEYYCNNGQLISKRNYPEISNDTMYYCNGNYVFTKDKYTGEYNYFSEDGKISTTGKIFNHKSEGLWKEYDENGNVIWYRYYQYGEEIYSGKDYPAWLREKE